jgi:hypothetical protein
VVFYNLAEQTHAAALFFDRHASGIVQRLGHFGKIVGINQDRS